MGSSKPVEETKKRKKGRPSLLDLQKRSLRLQKLEEENTDQELQHRHPNPSSKPDPGLRSPPSFAGTLRRSARRNPDVALSAAEDDDDDDEEGGDDGSIGRRRKEKKLRLVLRLPNSRRDDLDSSGSDSDARRKRPIDAVGGDYKTERQDSSLKAMDQTQEPSEMGPTTPLPDKKLLEFILDRLQKKDTYGVFSEPVDPNELPDYHDIIEHPMDFSTVRKKLATGAYANLEQFEKDISLISSNAMRYNSSDTIYYRQARQIQEHAKKNFENLRQESDDNEPEPKRPRRGRPPIKSIFKKIGRPSVERAGSDFSSSATLANAGNRWSHDSSREGLDRSTFEVSARSYNLGNREAPRWNGESKSVKDENYAGSLKGVAAKYAKKLSGLDENRRGTYNQSSNSSSTCESSLLRVLDGERKQLVPVGLLMQHAYARSLARFAANLGPIGWEIAAKQIERVLSPGTKFGQGWVGENDIFQPSQPALSSSPPYTCKTEPMAIPSKGERLVAEQHSNNSVVKEVCASTNISYPASSSVNPRAEIITAYENQLRPQVAGGVPETPFQLRQNPTIQPTMNGFSHQVMLNQQYQASKLVASKPPENSGVEAILTHSRALDLVSRAGNNYNHHAYASYLSKSKPASDPSVSSNSNHSQDSAHDSQGMCRIFSLNSKLGPVPPDLNVGLQSPGSPTSGLLVDSQHSNLALQL